MGCPVPKRPAAAKRGPGRIVLFARGYAERGNFRDKSPKRQSGDESPQSMSWRISWPRLDVAQAVAVACCAEFDVNETVGIRSAGVALTGLGRFSWGINLGLRSWDSPSRNQAVGSVALAGSSCARASSFGAYRSIADMRAPHSSSCSRICGAIASLPTAWSRLTPGCNIAGFKRWVRIVAGHCDVDGKALLFEVVRLIYHPDASAARRLRRSKPGSIP